MQQLALSRYGQEAADTVGEWRSLIDDSKNLPEIKKLVASTLPAASLIRLAIDYDTPWSQVEELLARAKKANQQTELLVGRRSRVRAIHLFDRLSGTPFYLKAYADGQACVQGDGTQRT